MVTVAVLVVDAVERRFVGPFERGDFALALLPAPLAPLVPLALHLAARAPGPPPRASLRPLFCSRDWQLFQICRFDDVSRTITISAHAQISSLNHIHITAIIVWYCLRVLAAQRRDAFYWQSIWPKRDGFIALAVSMPLSILVRRFRGLNRHPDVRLKWRMRKD